MIRPVVFVALMTSVLLINGCSSERARPVQPDGLHRVPVNRVPPVSPVSRVSPRSPLSPVTSLTGGSDEG